MKSPALHAAYTQLFSFSFFLVFTFLGPQKKHVKFFLDFSATGKWGSSSMPPPLWGPQRLCPAQHLPLVIHPPPLSIHPQPGKVPGRASRGGFLGKKRHTITLLGSLAFPFV